MHLLEEHLPHDLLDGDGGLVHLQRGRAYVATALRVHLTMRWEISSYRCVVLNSLSTTLFIIVGTYLHQSNNLYGLKIHLVARNFFLYNFD